MHVARCSELVDCSGPEGNQGCHGGKTYFAYDYIKKNGICTEDAYPYVPELEDCRAKTLPKSGVNLTAYKDVPQGNEAALQQTIQLGVVSVAVYCDSWYMFYKSGIYNDTCSSDPGVHHRCGVHADRSAHAGLAHAGACAGRGVQCCTCCGLHVAWRMVAAALQLCRFAMPHARNTTR
jgi:hypothetical protein